MQIYAGSINRDHVHMLIDSATVVGVTAVSERQEFAPTFNGVS